MIGGAKPRRRGFGLFGLLLCVLAVYFVIALLNPWALRIGGRWTPLLCWTGTGTLSTNTGAYPIYITLYPGQHFSRLRLDGLRATGGISGTAVLCTSRDTTIPLKVSGSIYNGWKSTDGSLVDVRLLEYNNATQRLNGATNQGYFDLTGHWDGPQLEMNDRGAWSHSFRSGLRIQKASVTLTWGSKSDFEAACASMRQHSDQSN
jgi:hypothetical protein